MKKGCLLLIILSMCLFATACSQPAEEPLPTDALYTCLDRTTDFDSMEAFHSALAQAKVNLRTNAEQLPGKLETLEEYYLPTGLPAGYSLYQIIVGAADIGFFYLPEAHLVSEDAKWSANAQSKYYLFISGRQHDFDAIVADQKAEDLVRETGNIRYYIHQLSDLFSTVIWEQDDTTLMITGPLGVTITHEDVPTLCKAQKHLVKDVLQKNS